MAYSDPQSITIGGTTYTLPRVGSGINSGSFATNDGLVRESIAHTYGRRTRRQLRVDLMKIAPDPLISAQNVRYSMSAYIVVDTPPTGFTVAEAKDVVIGLATYLSASTGARTTQLLGGES